MPRRRVAAVLAVAIVGVLVGLAVLALPAAAHADFVISTPAPYDIWNVAPTYVSVTVSEPVQPGSPKISVTNSTGDRVDSGPTTLSATDPTTFSVPLMAGVGPSVYTVTWSVVAADDGHFTAGTFYFMISYPNGTLPGKFPQTGAVSIIQPVSPLEVALDAGSFVGFAIAFGSTLVGGLLWMPLGSGVSIEERAGPTDGLRALLRFARIGAVAFAVTQAGRWAEALLLSPPAGIEGVLGSVFLLAAATEAVLGILMAVLITRVLLHVDPARTFDDRPWEFLVVLFLGFMAILLEASASHSAGAAGWWPLAPVADAIHLYGAALWAGGLLALFRTRRWLREPTPAAFADGLLRAFSRVAFFGVLLLVGAGVLLAVILVGSVNGLTGTGYGWVILAKSALLIPMVGLGAWNHRRLSRTAGAPTRESVEGLSRRVRAEAILGATILVLAGVLVTLNPAATPAAQNTSFTLDATSGGLYAILWVNPAPAGPGDYIFETTLYYENNGTPYTSGGNGTLSFLLVGGNGSWVTIPLEGPHGNHYFVDTTVLDAAGTWQLRVEVRGPQGLPVDLDYQVTLHA